MTLLQDDQDEAIEVAFDLDTTGRGVQPDIIQLKAHYCNQTFSN